MSSQETASAALDLRRVADTLLDLPRQLGAQVEQGMARAIERLQAGTGGGFRGMAGGTPWSEDKGGGRVPGQGMTPAERLEQARIDRHRHESWWNPFGHLDAQWRLNARVAKRRHEELDAASRPQPPLLPDAGKARIAEPAAWSGRTRSRGAESWRPAPAPPAGKQGPVPLPWSGKWSEKGRKPERLGVIGPPAPPAPLGAHDRRHKGWEPWKEAAAPGTSGRLGPAFAPPPPPGPSVPAGKGAAAGLGGGRSRAEAGAELSRLIEELGRKIEKFAEALGKQGPQGAARAEAVSGAWPALSDAAKAVIGADRRK